MYLFLFITWGVATVCDLLSHHYFAASMVGLASIINGVLAFKYWQQGHSKKALLKKEKALIVARELEMLREKEKIESMNFFK